MSWDVVFTEPNKTMGTKEKVRESLLVACEQITGRKIPRRGPTEVSINDSFCYEVLFIGHKRAIESLTLAFKISKGDPHAEPDHPARSFIRQVSNHTGWEAIDTYTNTAITDRG